MNAVEALRRHLDRGDLTCILCDHGAAHATAPRWQARFGASAFVGRALTVDAPAGVLDRIKEGVATLEPGDALVIGTGGAEVASWGENLTVAARARGAAGVVVAGYVRDVPMLERIGLPVTAYGVFPKRSDAKGGGSVGGEVRIGGASVRSGDAVVVDRNGVVIVPHERFDEICTNLDAWVDAERRATQEVSR